MLRCNKDQGIRLGKLMKIEKTNYNIGFCISKNKVLIFKGFFRSFNRSRQRQTSYALRVRLLILNTLAPIYTINLAQKIKKIRDVIQASKHTYTHPRFFRALTEASLLRFYFEVTTLAIFS